MTSTISSLALDTLNRVYAQKFEDVIVKNPTDPIFRLFNKVFKGGDVYNFGIRVVGNESAETYTEGQSTQNAGKTTVVQAVVPYVFYRSTAAITGHASAAAAGSPNESFFLQGELDHALLDLQDLIVSTLLGNSVNGLLGLVDSANALHSLSRTTYPNLASVETAGGSTSLTLDGMADTLTALELKNARPDIILMSPAMRQAYLDLVPKSASGGTTPVNVNTIALEGSRIVDLGYDRARASYDGIPIVVHNAMPNTDVLFLKLDGFELVEHVPFSLQLAEDIESDRKLFIMKYSCGLALKQPNVQGKISALVLS